MSLPTLTHGSAYSGQHKGKGARLICSPACYDEPEYLQARIKSLLIGMSNVTLEELESRAKNRERINFYVARPRHDFPSASQPALIPKEGSSQQCNGYPLHVCDCWCRRRQSALRVCHGVVHRYPPDDQDRSENSTWAWRSVSWSSVLDANGTI